MLWGIKLSTKDRDEDTVCTCIFPGTVYTTWNSPNSINVSIFMDVVAATLSALDQVGVEQRTRGRLVRWHYYSKVRCIDLTWHSNQGPNFCWYANGLEDVWFYHSWLHRWVKRIFCYQHPTDVVCNNFKKNLWLGVGKTNNDPSVVAGHFLQAVAKYGKLYM